MLRPILVLLSLALAGPAAARDWTMVAGAIPENRSPDGNSILIDAPAGLILVDTGRHADHLERVRAAAAARGRPIVAIVNTHWHLDHTSGNAALRAGAPNLPVHASTAIEGALTGFLAESRKGAEAFLASGRVTPAQAAEIRGDLAVADAPDALRPTHPVTRSGPVTIAGRRLTLNLASHAATEGDVWIHDPAARLVIAGDLVVALVPFMDTACPAGWRRALDAIAATRFDTLIPGHGAPMTRAAFLTWRRAFGRLLDCAAGTAARERCVAGWQRDAATFNPARDASVARRLAYYIDTRLRAPPAQATRYCPQQGR